MSSRHYILATAGHVDHGKSALVKALTGTDPDRLPEEKARGITIDLGFAHLELVTLDPGPSTLSLGIVDVPGHEDFVKNMVAGVGSIDLALLVVAADDRWMPQTEEHLQILMYLGVRRGVVALTKADLAEGHALQIAEEVREHLRDTPLANAPIVPTSILNGHGIEALKAALGKVLDSTPPPRDIGKPRLPVDRVFSLHGIGTVVTGTLAGGCLRRGQSVVIQPAGITARIRSIQSHNREVELSGPGTRTALNLADTAVGARDAGEGGNGVWRGNVITVAGLGGPADTLNVLLEKSARAGFAGAGRPLKSGTLVRVHLGSGNVAAHVILQAGEVLGPGQRRIAQLRSDTPVYAFAGDRFIVRDWAEQTTLAGGIVLDPAGDRKRFRHEGKFLGRRAEAPEDVRAYIHSQIERDGAVRRAEFLVQSRFSAEEISRGIAELESEGLAARAGEWTVQASWWQNLRQEAADAIDARHRSAPQDLGLPLHELRARLEKKAGSPDVLEVLIGELCRGQFRQVNKVIQRSTHRPALPPNLEGAGTRLRAVLAAKPCEPPSRKELAPDPVSQQALRFLLETGEATDLSTDTVMATAGFHRAVSVIKEHLASHGSATVSELRQAVGTNRRVIVPLLERMDREGITVRQGDTRALRRPGQGSKTVHF